MNPINVNLVARTLGVALSGALLCGALLCAPASAVPDAPANITASTPVGKPDLIVANVGVLESEDQVGTEAHLIARVENRGAAATKKDVAHGVAFYVDGEFVAWADTYRQDLKPGQFAIMRSNSGPNGRATWKITPGKHVFRAVADDVSRIDESNEENNAFEKTLEWKTPVATPMAMNSDERTEFNVVSREIYGQLRDLQKAGLFEVSNRSIRKEHLGTTDDLKQLALDLTRYEGAVALARLQDAMPALASDDKAQRLRAIDAATADAGRKLSATEIEALDGKILGLRVEFKDELAQLYMRGSGIETRPVTVAPRLIAPR